MNIVDVKPGQRFRYISSNGRKLIVEMLSLSGGGSCKEDSKYEVLILEDTANLAAVGTKSTGYLLCSWWEYLPGQDKPKNL